MKSDTDDVDYEFHVWGFELRPNGFENLSRWKRLFIKQRSP